MKKQDLNTNEHNNYVARYINQLSDTTDLKKGYEDDEKLVVDFFTSLTEEKLSYRYQPQKWSVKEVFQHMIDTERIFAYRLLRIARNDKTALPDYDQDIFIEPSGAHKKTITDLVTEFKITRAQSKNIINSLSTENLKNIATVSDSPISARACAFVIIGHNAWHIETLKNSYL